MIMNCWIKYNGVIYTDIHENFTGKQAETTFCQSDMQRSEEALYSG